ncbi:hypothetical protein AWRI3579_g557, partial [Hanseniaspora osmophila]
MSITANQHEMQSNKSQNAIPQTNSSQIPNTEWNCRNTLRNAFNTIKQHFIENRASFFLNKDGLPKEDVLENANAAENFASRPMAIEANSWSPQLTQSSSRITQSNLRIAQLSSSFTPITSGIASQGAFKFAFKSAFRWNYVSLGLANAALGSEYASAGATKGIRNFTETRSQGGQFSSSSSPILQMIEKERAATKSKRARMRGAKAALKRKLHKSKAALKCKLHKSKSELKCKLHKSKTELKFKFADRGLFKACGKSAQAYEFACKRVQPAESLRVGDSLESRGFNTNDANPNSETALPVSSTSASDYGAVPNDGFSEQETLGNKKAVKRSKRARIRDAKAAFKCNVQHSKARFKCKLSKCSFLKVNKDHYQANEDSNEKGRPDELLREIDTLTSNGVDIDSTEEAAGLAMLDNSTSDASPDTPSTNILGISAQGSPSNTQETQATTLATEDKTSEGELVQQIIKKVRFILPERNYSDDKKTLAHAYSFASLGGSNTTSNSNFAPCSIDYTVEQELEQDAADDDAADDEQDAADDDEADDEQNAADDDEQNVADDDEQNAADDDAADNEEHEICEAIKAGSYSVSRENGYSGSKKTLAHTSNITSLGGFNTTSIPNFAPCSIDYSVEQKLEEDTDNDEEGVDNDADDYEFYEAIKARRYSISRENDYSGSKKTLAHSFAPRSIGYSVGQELEDDT